MRASIKKSGLALGLAGIAIAAIAAIVWANRAPDEETWQPATEGFLAVATPCCTEASLWDSLSTESPDHQRPRAATPAEAAAWLNTWPYRERGANSDMEEPAVSMRSSEVRCVGPPSGPPVPRNDDDEETIAALSKSPACVYARWKVWKNGARGGRPNERHTVWADESGLLHGRVDYWGGP
ncbi:MAG: hypothetical protein WBG86_21620 [Polyangiales bacterium]